MKWRKLATSGWKSIVQTIAVLLLAQGANYIQASDYMVGGAMATLGFILFLIANYLQGG